MQSNPAVRAGVEPQHGARAFGLVWSSDLPLNDFETLKSFGRAPDIIVKRANGPPPIRQDAINLNRGSVCRDGVRLKWDREVIFDTYGAGHVAWRPGPDWTGRFPPALYSTVTAILLAWRGILPVHASAVEIGGRGYLICGASGAGKSTLAAGLIARGARLISDDLSAIRIDGDGRAILLPGRPSIRLHPKIGDILALALPGLSPLERRPPKALLRPEQVSSALKGIPLTGVILRDAPIEAADHAALADLWQRQLFRPRWMSALPHRRARESAMVHIGQSIPLISFASAEVHTPEDLDLLARRALITLTQRKVLV